MDRRKDEEEREEGNRKGRRPSERSGREKVGRPGGESKRGEETKKTRKRQK